MASAVLRCGLLLAFAVALGTPCRAAEPTRPSPARSAAAVRLGVGVPNVRIAGDNYVALKRVASHLGLKYELRNKGEAVVLSGVGTRAIVGAGTRDIVVNGLRVFLGQPSYLHRGDVHVSRIDFERCLAARLRPGYGVSVIDTPRVIAIDPGHGGRDHGMINSPLGINEKTFTLDTARRLKKLLEADGYRVVLTRDDDRYIELGERPAIANRAGADLFISIHFNALRDNTRTSGVEVFTFAPQFQRSTNAWMPGVKNDAEPQFEPGNAFDYWNSLLAHYVHRPFVTQLKASDRGKKIMHLGVLRTLRCPGVLIEAGFLSSDAEARKIATPAYRQQIAQALRDGVHEFSTLIATLRQKSRPSTTLSPSRSSGSS